MASRSVMTIAAVALALLVATASGARLLSTCHYGTVDQYKHCGTDKAGVFGPCKEGFICAYGNDWWSMCLPADECAKEGGYQCNRDACGGIMLMATATPANCAAGDVAIYQHCGKDSAGVFGSCEAGMICAFENQYWSMCLPPTECAKEGGYECNRDGCGNVVP